MLGLTWQYRISYATKWEIRLPKKVFLHFKVTFPILLKNLYSNNLNNNEKLKLIIVYWYEEKERTFEFYETFIVQIFYLLKVSRVNMRE